MSVYIKTQDGAQLICGEQTYETVDPILNNNSPETIQKVTQEGQAANYWSVGDKINITLSGTCGDITFYNDKSYWATIIGFDHNKDLETEGNPNIHFQFGRLEDGTDIVFTDSMLYSNVSTEGYFSMNSTDTNEGGWEKSQMRTNICEQFFNCLPSAWQNIIKPCTKYTDNVGGGTGHVESNITATSDNIFLLSYYEAGYTDDGWTNNYEKNFVEAYEIYTDDSSRIKYQYNSPSSSCIWWLRSGDYNYDSIFCVVYEDGNSGYRDASSSYGFGPGFSIS